MNEPRLARLRQLAAVSLLAVLAACRIANESEVGADGGAGGGAAACATNADCVGACPVGSVGCACVTAPAGLVCAPTCARPMDCPEGTICGLGGICVPGDPTGARDGGMHGGEGGARPDPRQDGGAPPPQQDGGPPPQQDGGPPPQQDGGPPGPKSCQTDTDCVGACPQGAHGCACNQSPQGLICVPTCDVAADCPPNPGGPQLTCNAGVCVPQQKP